MKTEQIIEQIIHSPINKNLAVGNDIVYLPSFIERCSPQFIQRVFTQNELAYCSQFKDAILRYASTWAAKEAVYKSIKQADDNIKLWWRDIEILRARPAGKPTVIVKKLEIPAEFSLSISHDKDYVWALAVCTYEKK